MTSASIQSDPEELGGPVQLTAQVVSDGTRFVAAVPGIELEGTGRTPEAAQNSLVQSMRSWMERLDTTGKLGDALGVDWLEEDTEIVLQFVDGNNAEEPASG